MNDPAARERLAFLDPRLLVLLVAALAIRLVFFGGLLGWDDIEYWESARALREGRYLPRTTFELRYTVTIPLALAQAWLGEREWVMALVPLTYSMIHLVLAWALGLLCGGPWVAAIGVALLAILPLDVIAATDLHADLPLAVFLAATVYAVLRGERAGASRRTWFLLAGISLGLGVITKEVAVAILAALAVRHLVARLPVSLVAYGWLAAGAVAVMAVEMVWLAAVTGDPLYRVRGPIPAAHAATILPLPANYTWMLDYPAMLLYPLSGPFGYFAGIVYLALAGTIGGLRRGDRTIAQLAAWWAVLLLLFNFAPLDASFTRPLFHHFARALHPLLIPLAVTAALWLRDGQGSRLALRSSAALGVVALSIAGILITHRDYRAWTDVARQAIPVIERLPHDVRIVTDQLTASQLRFLLPAQRDRIASSSGPPIAAGGGPVFVLSDPEQLSLTASKPVALPAVLTPRSSWQPVARFDRRPRASLRATLSRWLGRPPVAAAAPAPATLWRTGS